MAINITCTCGKSLRVPEALAGKKGKCPACGAILDIPAADVFAPPVDALLVDTSPRTPAPPPLTTVDVPLALKQKLHSPGMPPCWLNLSTEGAIIKTDFGIGNVLDAFVEAFAKKAKKQYDVQLGPAPEGPHPSATVQVISVDQGNRFLRYFLALFAGKTCLEVQGWVTSPAGRRQDFYHKHKGSMGFFGGSSEGLLKVSARVLGKKVAKTLLKLS